MTFKKFVLNKNCDGNFPEDLDRFSEWEELYQNALARGVNYYSVDEREHPELVAFIEKLIDEGDYDGELKIAIYPEEATDILVHYEDDGSETLLYALNGKIKYAEVLDD